MPLQIYTRVRLLNDDRVAGDKLFHKGAEATLIGTRVLKTRGRLYRIEILDQRCNGHWTEVEEHEIEPVDEKPKKKRKR